MSTTDPVLDDAAIAEALTVIPNRPSVTPIQLTAIVGVVIQVARAFGVWDASAEQTDALNAATALLGALVFGDATLRGFRNLSPR